MSGVLSRTGSEPFDNAAGDAQNAFDRLLQPDTILPCQMAPAGQERPEMALAMAVLQQALADYQVWSTSRPLRPIFELGLIDLKEWFASDRIDPHSFSFAWLCEVLNLAPADVRRWIAKTDLSGVVSRHRKAMQRPHKMELRRGTA